MIYSNLNNTYVLFYIAAKVIVRVPSNTAVVEGEKMVITCTVLGYKPRLSWSIIGEHHWVARYQYTYMFKVMKLGYLKAYQLGSLIFCRINPITL